MLFRDRRDAGRQLAMRLDEYRGWRDVLVLALPRGGVPVAAEIAARLGAPLDVWLVRKLGVPGSPELAMGAIASGGVEILNHDVIDSLQIPSAAVQGVAMRERLELDRRNEAFRDGRAQPIVRRRIVVLVDDGLATGATMEAAIVSVRQLQPKTIVVAVPVGASDTCERLRRLADRLVCPYELTTFRAVGEHYADFAQTTDDEVRRLLAAHAALTAE